MKNKEKGGSVSVSVQIPNQADWPMYRSGWGTEYVKFSGEFNLVESGVPVSQYHSNVKKWMQGLGISDISSQKNEVWGIGSSIMLDLE